MTTKTKKKKRGRRSNGEGTIVKRSDGRYQASATINGKRKYYYDTDYQRLQEKLREVLYNYQKNIVTDAKNLTVGQWLDIWLEDYCIHFKPKTYNSYKDFIRLHIKPELENKKLEKLTSSDLQKLYNSKFKNGRVDGQGGLKPRSVERIHTIIHSALEQAVADNLISKNVSKNTKLPAREIHEARYFTIEEQKNFISNLNIDGSKYDVALLLDLGTGLRKGELLALTWKNIDFKKKQIKVKNNLVRTKDRNGISGLYIQSPKTKKSIRVVPIPSYLNDLLITYKEKQKEAKIKADILYQDNDLVFCTNLGKPLEPRNFNRRFSEIIKKAGIKNATVHSLRHTYATRLLENNTHPKIVQELLGHSSITTTMNTYSHVINELKHMSTDSLNEMLIIDKLDLTKEKSSSQDTQEEDK